MRNLPFGARAGIVLAMLVACCTCCGGGLFAMVGLGMGIEAAVADLTPACDGRGVPSAVAYAPGPSIHPTTAFERREGAWHYVQPMTPSAWQSQQTASTQLVLCLEEEQESLLETCPYTTGLVVSRYSYARAARLVVAQTGQVLDTRSVVGDPPPVCTEWANGAGSVRYDGTHPDGASVERAFRGLIGP